MKNAIFIRLIFSLCCFSSSAFATETLETCLPPTSNGNRYIIGSELHVQTGVFTETLQSQSPANLYNFQFNPISTSFLDLNYELFTSNKNSFYLKTTFGYQSTLQRLTYDYFGIGKRYYFSTNGIEDNGKGAGGTWQFFAGADLGIGQYEIGSFGGVFSLVTDNLEIGAVAGVKRQLTPTLGLELTESQTYGWGFSAVNINVSTFRSMLGLSAFF